jgi:hypothetical protein
MTSQQSSTGAGDPVVSLQPLTFKKVQDDGRVAVFQTKIPDIKMPDVAAPILTVSVPSPDGDEAAAQEIDEFLNEMRAGFALTGGKVDEESGDDPEPFNPAKEILFTFGPPGPGSTEGAVGMTVVVQTTVEETTVEQTTVEEPRVLRVKGSVLRNHSHRYVAPQMVSATVASTGGSAQVTPGGRINTGGSTTRYTRTITITGITKCSYRLTGAVFAKVY